MLKLLMHVKVFATEKYIRIRCSVEVITNVINSGY